VPQAVEAAKTMAQAIESALSRPETRTRDIRGTTGTDGMTDAIVRAIG
jgi:3-isopropylmalate dehydrogenase